ncbi:MAG: 3-oxoacyl-[acyl-carrier-protein] reductase [Planctomycetes bacterium]|nr:3-oxoacyl-[acyl-carrier-protein] reductase [Planctomycetota bacterium]
MSESLTGPLTIDLSGQVALVTGASRGIGRAIAERLAGCGAWVACIARNEEKLAETVESIRSNGGQTHPFQADVSNKDAVEKVVEEITESHGKIDILINNAGITRDGLVLRMEDEEWQSVLDTNLTGTFYFTRAVTRSMMQKRYGRIVNIASISGIMGNSGQANYSASKAGMIGFTKSVAKELAKRGVTANVVAPGFVTTDMTDALPENMRAELKKVIPVRRFGEPTDIADTVAFLASPLSGYITAQVLSVDGGLVI